MPLRCFVRDSRWVRGGRGVKAKRLPGHTATPVATRRYLSRLWACGGVLILVGPVWLVASNSIPAAAAGSAAAGGLVPVPATRVLDTRSGVGGTTGPVGAGQPVSLSVLGVDGVPASGVGAVVLNVAVTQPATAGYVTVYADGAARPNTANLNFLAGETVPNLVIAPVGADGRVEFYNGSAGTVQIIADLSGWFAAGSATPGAIRPIGNLVAASAPAGANPVSLSVHPQNAGDLMLLGIEDSNTTPPTVASVSGGGASSWTLVASDSDAAYTQDGDEIWEGVVTTPGQATITITINGYSDGDDLLAQEFTAGGSVTWSLDKSAKVSGISAQGFTYPSLSPASSSELYFGIGNAVNNTQLVGEGTPGVTYINTGLECVSLVAYDTDTSSTLAPAVANSSGNGNWETALAVLIQG
jgi:hypothetical protein